MDIETAKRKLKSHLDWKYHKTLDDVVITETRGYWKDKTPCDVNTCHSPLHSCIGNEKPIYHTYYYAEHGLHNPDGKFTSPFRVWNALKEGLD